MLVASIILLFICVLLSMCEIVILNDDIPNEKQVSTIQWLLFTLCICSLFLILKEFNITEFYTSIGLILVYSIVFMTIIYKFPKWLVIKNIDAAKKVLNPFIKLLTSLFSFISWLFKFKVEPPQEQASEEEIRKLINDGSEIEEPQKEFIENIFEFDDTNIEELCTHRSKVIMLYLNESVEQWQKTIHDNRHTFYPVCGEDDDDIVGVLDTRDYFRIDGQINQDVIINKAMDKPFFVSENTKADDCFYEMKKRRNYFAIVLDEYGGMTGIVTLHDIVEELLGEMHEEDEVILNPIQRIDWNQWYIDGTADLEDVQEKLGVPLPIEDYDTFNGYLLSKLGRIPEDGSIFEIVTEDMVVNVKEVKNHLIGQTITQVYKRKENENYEES